MVKGIQRRIVEVKLNDSKTYESACFVLRQKSEIEKKSDTELIEEARRIAGSLEPHRRKKVGRQIAKILLVLLLLFVGAAIGFSLSFLFLG